MTGLDLAVTIVTVVFGLTWMFAMAWAFTTLLSEPVGPDGSIRDHA